MKYVVDIDDTLLESIFVDGRYILKDFNVKLVKELNILFDLGNLIIIFTGRHWNHLEDTLDHLKKIGLKYHTLVLGKPPADILIDDKSKTAEDFLDGK